MDAVYDGEEALFQARQDIYDLILLDIMIPFIDGFTVLSKIRNSAIVGFNSDGRDSVEDKVKGLRLGADDYITNHSIAMNY